MLSAIVAMAHNRVIGNKNDLPWYLPADLKHFKELTTGHPVIMGRTTAESIVNRLGHGLPDRENIVITRDTNYLLDGFRVVHSVEEAINHVAGHDAFVIGGAQIYEQMLPYIHTLHITEVDAAIEGDVAFPDYNHDNWREVTREIHRKDDKNQYDYSFVTLERS